MSKPTKLGPEAALELFRFSLEQLIQALYPDLDRRLAATEAKIIEAAVLRSLTETKEYVGTSAKSR